MPIIITLPDELAEKLQAQADARQLSINDCAIDFLEKALEVQPDQQEDDFKILGAQIRSPLPQPAPVLLPKKPSEKKAYQDDDASDFDDSSAKWGKVGDKIRDPALRDVASRLAECLEGAGEQGSDVASSEGSSSPDDPIALEVLPHKESYQNRPDFQKLGTQLKGRAPAIATTGWLLDPMVSPMNDHKYQIDLEQWNRLWAKVKIEMRYEQPSA